MKIIVASGRGHHECVCEPEIGKALFEKLIGRTSEALPSDLKTKVPETFQELAALWEPGKLGYMAFRNEEMIKQFDPAAEEVTFMPAIRGG